MTDNTVDLYINKANEELVRLIRSEDDIAFKILYERFLPKIRSMTYSFQGLGYEVEDLMQEATIGFFTAINLYNFESSSFSTFCYICMRRMLVTLLRKAGRKKNLPNSSVIYTEESFFEAPVFNDPESEYIAREDFERLKVRIHKELSATERKVLYYYLSGMDYVRIGEKLKISDKSVDNALQRVRRKLR